MNMHSMAWIRWPARTGEPFQTWLGGIYRTFDGLTEALAACPPQYAILLPGVWCSVFSLTLPPMRANKREKAALFALEDQLASDIQSVHLHVYADPSDVDPQRFQALVLSRAVLETVYRALHLLPQKPLGVFVDFTVFQPDLQGSGVWVDPTGYALLKHADHTDAFYPEEQLLMQRILLNHPVSSIASDQPWVWRADCDLLVGADRVYKQKTTGQRLNLKSWALGSMVFFFMFLGLERVALQRENHQWDQKVLSAYQAIEPRATRPISARAFLSRLENASRSDPVFEVLHHLGLLLKKHPKVLITHLERRQNQISLDLELPSAAVWDDWIRTLKAHVQVVSDHIQQGTESSLKGHMVLTHDAH